MWTMRPDGTQVQRAVEIDFHTSGLNWSPDGKRMVFTVTKARHQSSLWIAAADGSAPRQVSAEFDYVSARWLSNTRLLVCVITDNQVADLAPAFEDYANYVLDLQDNAMQLYSQGPQEEIPIPPGNRWLAWNGVLGFRLHDLEGNIQSLPELSPYGPRAFDVSPAGDWLIACGRGPKHDSPIGLYVAAIEPEGVQEPKLVYWSEEGVCGHTRWSPDGRYIAVLNHRHVLHLFDSTTFSLVRQLELASLVQSDFYWSPDARFIAVHRHYGELEALPKELARVDIETGETVRLTYNDRFEILSAWVAQPAR